MRFVVWILALLLALAAHAQDSIRTNAANFGLRNGIYFDQNSFLLNQPDLRFAAISNRDGQPVTPTNFNPQDYSYFKDSLGVQVPLDVNQIFGYSIDGTFYKQIVYQNEVYFGRSVNPGALWQFAAVVTTVNTVTNPADPYFNNFGTYTTTTKNLLQVVYYLEANQTLALDPRKVLPIIRQDPVIAEMMDKKSKRKQRKMVYYFLRKYNQRNPIVFPAR